MEQIVFSSDFRDNKICSHVQLRGSVPIVWGQELDLSYRPNILVHPDAEKSFEASKLHFNDIIRQYAPENEPGKVICVNLLDDFGVEVPLSARYEEAIDRFGSEYIQYESFPIARWCKGMKFKNMDILNARVSTRMIDAGVFFAEGIVPGIYKPGSLKVSEIQKGLMRVNCLDSLDRTNLTCSLFARNMLPLQLAYLNSRDEGDFSDVDEYRKSLAPHISLLTNLWADSGDSVSILYAGTRALRADVTRTGKRQFLKGSIDDTLNSFTRYYLNNFADGKKQDTFDLLTGKVTPAKVFETNKQEGLEKAERIKKPILTKKFGLGWFLPKFLVDQVEPILQTASSFRNGAKKTAPTPSSASTSKSSTKGKALTNYHVDANGNPQSYIGLLVSTIRLYAPDQVTSSIQFITAMIVFFYILVCVKIFQIKGKNLVGRPKRIGCDSVVRNE
jgi:hypothetical protein